MSLDSNEIIKDLVNHVINDTPHIFKPVDALDLMEDPSLVSNNVKAYLASNLIIHAENFYEIINKKSSDITYGLALGLTKRFCEFSAKLLSEKCPKISEGDLVWIYNIVTEPIATHISEFVKDEIVVYVMYRELKKEIDKQFDEQIKMLAEIN